VSVPEHVTLAREAQAAGLIVTHLMPAPPYGDRYSVQLWQPDGALWVEGRESAAMIRAHVNHYPAHQHALTEGSGLRLVIPGDGAALTCGCLTDTTDTTKESK
jgi:hypothetical protein